MSPTAAPFRWPYREHRTMAQVIASGGLDASVFAGTLSWQEALARQCPRCGCPPAMRCKTPGGHPLDSLHAVRRKA